MHTRRFTRLTNGFSKKVENHAHSVALFAMYYNFVRIHATLKVTPAMAVGVTKRLWEIGDIVDVLEAWEARPQSKYPTTLLSMARTNCAKWRLLGGQRRGCPLRLGHVPVKWNHLTDKDAAQIQ